MGMLTFQIKKIPDLSLNKYQSLANTGVEGVLARHSSFLRQWHGLCMESQTSIHLLYCFEPSDAIGNRLKIYFVIQGEAGELSVLKPLIMKSPLSDYYDFSECVLPRTFYEAGATLVKNEDNSDIPNPLTAGIKKARYVPGWTMNSKARLYDLFRMMETLGLAYPMKEACAYRIDLYPASMVSVTRDEFTPVIRDLQGDNDIRLLRESVTGGRDTYTQSICKEYEDWISKLERSPHFRVNIYAFAKNIFLSKVLLNAVGSEAVSEGDFYLASIKPDSNGQYTATSRMDTMAKAYSRYRQSTEEQPVWDTWSTTYLLEEVEPFFRFPVLYDGEKIEIPKETAPQLYSDGIYLGESENGYPVYFPVEDLPRHAFFTGTPGSGKTNTMMHLVTELKKKDIPFLIMEPAKKEYRALLADPKMKDVYLFSPHLQSHFPLRMNPFEFPKGVRLSEHINALLEVFQGSFVLEGATFAFLSRSIEKAYIDLGWSIEDINEANGLEYPTLKSIYDNLEKEIDKSSYESDIKGNVRAFLQVRLGSLMERDAGEVFNSATSTLRPEQWLDSSAIVELEVLNEQAKNFFVLLVCHYVLETLRVDPNGGVDSVTKELLPVRHAIFIEEAHNIIAPSTEQSSTESVDPKISATAYIVKMLAEVRALREAIIIADQLPTALASEVVKNTGLKLVHRLTAGDDRQEIGAAISASAIQMERMASFSKGKALIFYEKTQKPYEIQIAKWSEPEMTFNYANDRELYVQIADRMVIIDSIKEAYNTWMDRIWYPFIDDWEIFEADYEKFKKRCSNSNMNNRDVRNNLKYHLGVMTIRCERLKKNCQRMFDLWCRGIDVQKNQGIHEIIEDLKKNQDDIKWCREYMQAMQEHLGVLSE